MRNKPLNRPVIGTFNLGREIAGRQFIHLSVVRYTFTADAFARARLVCAIAVNLIVAQLTFTHLIDPTFISLILTKGCDLKRRHGLQLKIYAGLFKQVQEVVIRIFAEGDKALDAGIGQHLGTEDAG
jgi:hypothetical protein